VFFVRVHNETLTVAATGVSNPIVRPLESIAQTQHQLQPALLRLSAMIPASGRPFHASKDSIIYSRSLLRSAKFLLQNGAISAQHTANAESPNTWRKQRCAKQ